MVLKKKVVNVFSTISFIIFLWRKDTTTNLLHLSKNALGLKFDQGIRRCIFTPLAIISWLYRVALYLSVYPRMFLLLLIVIGQVIMEICSGFLVPTRIFPYGNVTITSEELQNLINNRYSLPLSSESSLSFQTYCETGHHLPGPVILTPVAEHWAVEQSLPLPWLGIEHSIFRTRGENSNRLRHHCGLWSRRF